MFAKLYTFSCQCFTARETGFKIFLFQLYFHFPAHFFSLYQRRELQFLQKGVTLVKQVRCARNCAFFIILQCPPVCRASLCIVHTHVLPNLFCNQ